jgi:hypothetical protein
MEVAAVDQEENALEVIGGIFGKVKFAMKRFSGNRPQNFFSQFLATQTLCLAGSRPDHKLCGKTLLRPSV